MHGLRLSIFVVTAHEFDAFWREALSSWLELLTILYNSLCVVFFQAFYCVDLPGGYSLLRLATCRTTRARVHLYIQGKEFSSAWYLWWRWMYLLLRKFSPSPT